MIAAVEGYAVAGGIELALWCDLRVARETATFGVFCRRFGVPLIDGGTVRLPRLIGESRAIDLILTGRPVGADEALALGLANRVVADGQALAAALALARTDRRVPAACLRNDRLSARRQHGLRDARRAGAGVRARPARRSLPAKPKAARAASSPAPASTAASTPPEPRRSPAPACEDVRDMSENGESRAGDWP